MDPDLMMSFAEMGCSQLPEPSRWNTSTTAVYEFEEPVPYEDDEAERLVCDRARLRSAMFQPAVEGDANSGVEGVQISTDQAGSQQQHKEKKRRWSTRLSEAFTGFGKSVKKRTNSWSKRKDSVVAPDPEPVVLVGETADASEGSGERSRDGDDELGSGDEPLSDDEVLRFTTATSGVQLPLQDARTMRSAEMERCQYPDQVPQPMAAVAEEDTSNEGFDWDYQRKQYHLYGMDSNPQDNLAMLARGVRIAERRGDFAFATRERTFKNLNRLCRTDSSQSQASIALKAKLARKKAKSESRFRSWKEFRDSSPFSKLKKVWRKNGAEVQSAEESESRSEIPGPDEDERSRPKEPIESLPSRDSTDEWREDNVEAAKFVGWTLQKAPQPF